MSSLSAAVIGTGFIGPVHIEGLLRAGVHVAGVLGSSPEKSKATADQWDLPKAYASLEELLSDENVDVVHITSPNQHHFEQASKSLLAGKHVLCEKPLAMNSRQSSELVRIATESGRAAGVNYNIRYYPLCLEASERMRHGTSGKVWQVTGSYVQDWLFSSKDYNWRVSSTEGGELRAVADIGTHWMDLVQFVCQQRITDVMADLQIVHPQRYRPAGSVETFSGKIAPPQASDVVSVSTEDCGCILLRFEEGGRGMLSVSQVTAGRKNCLRFELAGSEESLAWNSERPNELWIGHRERPNELLLRDPALLAPRASEHCSYPAGHNEGFPDTFKQLFRDFYSAIEQGTFATQPTYPTFADGHYELLVCEAILASHRDRSWKTVPSC